MKLTFVAPFGLRPKSTVSVRMLPLARELVRRGHGVTLLIPPWDNPEDSGVEFLDGGVRVVNLALPGRFVARAEARRGGGEAVVRGLVPRSRAAFAQLPIAGYPALGLRLLNQTTASRPDIVHAFKPKGFSGAVAQALLARPAITGKRVPVVVDTDDWEGPGGWNERAGYPRWQQAVFTYQERWLLRHAHAVTAASQTLVQMALDTRRRGWVPRSRFAERHIMVPNLTVTYLPNGAHAMRPYAPGGPGPIDTASAATAEALRARLSLGDAPVLLLYTRFVESPPQRIVRIIEAIHQQGAHPVTLLVGAGLHGEEHEFLHAMNGLPVVNAGWVPGAELPAYFALADAAMFPMEDNLVNRAKCSVKLVDLLSAGVPVVAEAVGQCVEYIEDGASGLLVPPGDFEAFGKAVAGVLEDVALRDRLREGAQARIAHSFAWEQLAARLEQTYTNALAGS